VVAAQRAERRAPAGVALVTARRHSYCARCGIDYRERRLVVCGAYGRSYSRHIWTWDCDDDCDEHG
jgi:hypothetical protein